MLCGPCLVHESDPTANSLPARLNTDFHSSTAEHTQTQSKAMHRQTAEPHTRLHLSSPACHNNNNNDSSSSSSSVRPTARSVAFGGQGQIAGWLVGGEMLAPPELRLFGRVELNCSSGIASGESIRIFHELLGKPHRIAPAPFEPKPSTGWVASTSFSFLEPPPAACPWSRQT